MIKIMRKKLLRQLASIEKALNHSELGEHFAAIKNAIQLLPELNEKTTEFEIPMDLIGKEMTYILYSDGACRGNPGPGAFGFIVQDSNGSIILENAQTFAASTNNRMELQGVISGLLELKALLEVDSLSLKDIHLRIITDSRYVIDGITKWITGWKNRGWKKADNKVPENLDLWQDIDVLTLSVGKLEFEWVKGHTGHPQNEHCDKIANQALDYAGF